MKTIPLISIAIGMALLTAGCSSTKVVHERGWIGGSYKLAKRPGPFQTSDVVPAFPDRLKRQQSAGIFIAATETNSPVANAGLQSGDLILALDHQPIQQLQTFWKKIDAQRPGAVISASILRNGEVMERDVTVGRETFHDFHTLGLGLKFSRHWDLLPNPDFSLIALGYKKNQRRVELKSPETEFVRHVRTDNDKADHAEAGVNSREGWETWLVLLSFGERKQILSQEAFDKTSVAAQLAVVANQ